MARRKTHKRSTHAHRSLHLESFEARLALAAAEMPATEFQFDGQVIARWIDEQNASDSFVVASLAPGAISPAAIQNLLTIVGSIEQRPGGMVSLNSVRNWLDRPGAVFNFTLPATDGGYIDLSGPADFGNSGGLGSYEQPSSGEPFEAPGGPVTPGEIGSLDETTPHATPSTPSTPSVPPTPSTPSKPIEPGPNAGQSGGGALEAWSSLGRPAVIGTEDSANTSANTTTVKYARTSETGGWIALEPILAQTDADNLESLRLASPEAYDSKLSSAEIDLDLKRDEALSGEWARAAVFEIIGGDPTESQPVGRPAANRKIQLQPGDPEISDSEAPSTTLGAATIPAQAVALIAGSGWFDDISAWVRSRTSAAIDNLFESDKDDASLTLGGWRDYAGAGAILLAIALERLSAHHREEQQSAEANRSEKLRLRRAEFAHRLSMRLRPIETR